jgi:hypothetical protein
MIQMKEWLRIHAAAILASAVVVAKSGALGKAAVGFVSILAAVLSGGSY